MKGSDHDVVDLLYLPEFLLLKELLTECPIDKNAKDAVHYYDEQVCVTQEEIDCVP